MIKIIDRETGRIALVNPAHIVKVEFTGDKLYLETIDHGAYQFTGKNAEYLFHKLSENCIGTVFVH